MDRPATVTRLTIDNSGLYTVGSRDPRSLERLSAALFAELEAINANAFVAGMHLGGGGGGADWQLTYTILNSSSPGYPVPSCWVGKARVWCRIAPDATELDRTCQALLASILAEYADATVYDVQLGGSGRDGAYLVAVLFGDSIDQPPYEREQNDNEQGPFSTETALLPAVRIWPTPAANDQTAVLVEWSVLVKESSNNGIFIRLQYYLGAGPTGPWTTAWEATCSTGSGDWYPCGGHAEYLQPAATTDSLYVRLAVAANAPTTVTARNAFLSALRVGKSYEFS